MSVITFTSDFGLQDHYVASVKAEIYRRLPAIPVFDISHLIKNSNIAQAAYTINAVFADFPAGSVHMVAVDTAGRREDRFLAALIDGHFFLASDNGLFSLIGTGQPAMLVTLSIADGHFRSFPAKYVLAKAATELAQGQPLATIGTPTDQFERKLFKKAVYDLNQIKGYVVHVDHYGNLITNITRQEFLQVAQGRRYNIRFEYENIQGISASYGSKEYGDCLVLFNSNQRLEIAINHGHAAQLLGMQFDSSVLIDFIPKLQEITLSPTL